jgi:hypothetical protein
MTTRSPAKSPTRKTATGKAVSTTMAAPIKALTASAKLKLANSAALKAGLSKVFKAATPVSTWGFNAANNSALGALKAGPGIGLVDFDAKSMTILSVDSQTFPRPLTLDVKVAKGFFYVVDVYCSPSNFTNFFATSHRTTSGANYTAQYAMTLDTLIHHFTFVLQAHGSADGATNSYRIEIGADQPWMFEKIEMTKVE